MRKLCLPLLVWGIVLGLVGCTRSTQESPTTLNLDLPQKIKGLDPSQTDDLYSSTAVSYAYDGLLKYHYLKRPYVLEANIATAMPTVSADGKTLTFKLRTGILFQDDPSFKATNGKGRELVAQDFIYSFMRLADPKNSSPGWWIFDGKIVGLNEWRDEASKSGKSDYTKKVEGLRALDRYTLQIELKARSEQFLYALAMSYTFPVPQEAVEFYGADFIRTPVGTGPYVLDRKASDISSKLVWVKNPTYRDEFYPREGEAGDKELGLLDDAGKKLPLAEKVILNIIPETQPRWLNFLAGKLDRAEVPKDNIAQAVHPDGKTTDELKKQSIRMQRVPQLEIVRETFNLHDPLMKNKLLRQAISLAINVDQIIELFYGGQATPLFGPIPQGIVGYDPNLKNPYRQHDLEKAKQMLAKAGYPEGKGLTPIEYASVSRTVDRQQAEYMQKQLSEIGVQLKLTFYTWPEFQQVIKNRKAQMWGWAWGADYPDGENFLQLFYSKNLTPGPNDSSYENPVYDRLYEQALSMRNTPERTTIYRKMAEILVEDAVNIWKVSRMKLIAVNPWLKGDKYHEMENGYVRYMRVDPELKKKHAK